MNFVLVGHRGDGANGPLPGRPVQFMENTVESFLRAAENGAQMVEFDVQLTKDMKPVVFHDFFVCRQKRHYRISELDYSELVDLVIHGKEPSSLGEADNPFWNGHACSKCQDQAGFQVHKFPIPLLEDVLDLPLQLNVEIKYPYQDEVEDQHLATPVPIDEYCRTILRSIGGKSVMFSSFHPDVTAWLAQNTKDHEIFFLTDAGMSVSKYDPRLNSLQAAIQVAKELGLAGIVANAAGLLKNGPSAIPFKLFTYGKENCDAALVETQVTQFGVSGIITDDLVSIAKLKNND